MTKRNGLMATGAAGLVLSAGLALGPRFVAEPERPQGTEDHGEEGHRRRPLPSDSDIAALPPDGGPDWNRLVFKKSPPTCSRTRQTPVDWFPRGYEAFATAGAEHKPIFLSIGYSTCHWCHVIEEESFEDPEVAALLNEHFISIKVDREERPDVDQLYMSVTQAMTGSGGWPMTVVMTPDRRPFFAGTYFPKRGRFGRQGMMELLPALAKPRNRETPLDRRDEAPRSRSAPPEAARGYPGRRHASDPAAPAGHALTPSAQADFIRGCAFPGAPIVRDVDAAGGKAVRPELPVLYGNPAVNSLLASVRESIRVLRLHAETGSPRSATTSPRTARRPRPPMRVSSLANRARSPLIVG